MQVLCVYRLPAMVVRCVQRGLLVSRLVHVSFMVDPSLTHEPSHRSHLNITPILSSTASNPTVLESLVFWTRSAIGAEQGYKVNVKDVSGGEAPFDEKSGLARNGSVNKKTKGGVSVSAESDVSLRVYEQIGQSRADSTLHADRGVTSANALVDKVHTIQSCRVPYYPSLLSIFPLFFASK